MKKVILAGGAGNGNFGDELIVKNWLNFLNERFSDTIELVVEGFSRDKFLEIFPDPKGSIEFSNTLVSLMSCGPDDFFDSIIRGFRFFRNGGFKRHPAHQKYDHIVERCGLFHIYGGGYLNRLWSKTGFLVGLGAALKMHYGIPAVMTGVGMMPLDILDVHDKRHSEIQHVLGLYDLIETRDPQSANYLLSLSHNIRVFYGLDDCFLETKQSSLGSPSLEGERSFRLHLSDFSSAGLLSHLEELVRVLADQAAEIFFWACTKRDLECVPAWLGNDPKFFLLDLQDLVHKPLPVSVGDIMITARFHPHLVGAIMGCNGLYRNDRQYYDVKHKSVLLLGSSFLEYPWNELENVNLHDLAKILISKKNRHNVLHWRSACLRYQKRKTADQIYSSIFNPGG